MSVRRFEEMAVPKELVPSPDSIAQLPVLEGEIAVVDFLLLLPVHQATALEAAAHRFGLTVGHMARYVIRDFLDREELQFREQGSENACAFKCVFDAWQTAAGAVEPK